MISDGSGALSGPHRRTSRLLQATSLATFSVLVGLFGGWFLAFFLMGWIVKSLPVGMNYLAWPIVFPLLAAPFIFVTLGFVIHAWPGEYMATLSLRRFQLMVIVPVASLALILMLATCPLDTGGTFMSRGWEAFIP